MMSREIRRRRTKSQRSTRASRINSTESLMLFWPAIKLLSRVGPSGCSSLAYIRTVVHLIT